jgi:acid stress chaperone HdeB
MSLITCKQYMTSDPERQQMIASWMSGYFSASKNLSTLDFRYVDYNKKVVGALAECDASSICDAVPFNPKGSFAV